MASCPCGSGLALEKCCLPYINGDFAPTAESLMRSRYTAFSRGNLDYIEQTLTEHAALSFNRVDMESALPGTQWLGLDIRHTDGGGSNDNTGTVNFAFHYQNQGRNFSQVEIASFQRVDGKWLYDDSVINPKSEPIRVDQIGRNDPCPCGSGKKYKKCCGSQQAAVAAAATF